MLKDIKMNGIVTKYTNKNKSLSLKKEDFSISTHPNIILNQINKEETIYNFDKKFNECIYNFIIQIRKENQKINLDLFFKNLKSLTIKEKKNFNKFIFFKSNIRGSYNSRENTIYLLKNNYLHCINHELLHCASKINIEGATLVGFRQTSDSIDIGYGLNEGYTELLEERYFKHKKTGYTLEKYISSLLEKIIDKEKMENLFFNADLYNLIEELGKYSHKKEIITFIKYLDEVYHDTNGSKQLKEANKKFNFISNFLIFCYSKKLYELYNEDSISFDYFKKESASFINLLCRQYTTKNNKYTLLTIEDAEEMMENFCNEILELDKKKNKVNVK